MKMYSLGCSDMGIDCKYIAKADTKDEVIKMASDHFGKSHPEESKEMGEKMTPEEMNEKMMGGIKEED